jgi:hypothetical protein
MILRRSLVRWSLGVTIFSLAAVPGCSDDGLGRRYSVTGKVAYKGQPLERGLISFIAVAPDGRSATGVIKNGTYSLTTQDTDDGAFPGQYVVTVAARTADYAEAEAKAKQKGSTSAYLPQGFATEADKKAKNAIPDKYGIPTSSPLKAEVKAHSNKLDFDLVD